MRFSQTLSAHLTPEWRIQYICYEDLKNMLLEALENAPSSSTPLDSPFVQRYYAAFEETFFQQCEYELRKINVFYAEKLAEAQRVYSTLLAELRNSGSTHDYRSLMKSTPFKSKRTKRTLDGLKFDFSEYYLSLVLLQNYQSLNYTGFRKILKKHDKLLNNDKGHKWFNDWVASAFFHDNHDLLNLIRNTENTFIHSLANGDRAKAMKRLRVPPLERRLRPWTTFRVGLLSGIFVVLAAVTAISFNSMMDMSQPNAIACVRLYRGPFMLFVFLIFIGCNVNGWRKAGVNHVLIFELEPRDNLSAPDIFELAFLLGDIWLLSFLGFMYWRDLNIPPFIHPLWLLLIMLGWLVNPLKVFHYTARIWLLRVVGRMLSAPFSHVGFPEFWLADQLNSLVICLLDYEYIICFYVTNVDIHEAKDPNKCMEKDFIISPLVSCLPAWFRFAQCIRRYYESREAFPFLVNAGKYSTTFAVVLFNTLMCYYKDSYATTFQNPFVWAYIISHVISSVYCCAWDLLRDFTLFVQLSGENIFLREQIVYNAFFYYCIIIENFLIRFFWIVSFFLVQLEIILPYNMATIESFLETCRRYLWNYIRLENEHLFNRGRFRAVRDISVKIMDLEDQTVLQNMMDVINGVENRGKDKKDN